MNLFRVEGIIDRKYYNYMREGGYRDSPDAIIVLCSSGPSSRTRFNLSFKEDRDRLELFLVDNFLLPF